MVGSPLDMVENSPEPVSSELTSDTPPPVSVGGSEVKLALGDIIQLIAPNHDKLHEQTFLVDYIDQTHIELLDIASLTVAVMNMDNRGYLTDESVEKIYILSRSDEEGYARQHGLLPKTWVDIHIGGDIPVIITGQITNLDEDMIEITTYPEMDVIYVDFEYKGLPRNIPFERFEIREKPDGILARQFSRTLSRDEEATELETLAENEAPIDAVANSEDYAPQTEVTIRPDAADLPEKNMFDVLNSLYLAADELIFGEELEDVHQVVELPENQRRYGVETQANDLMDELLSTIPNSRRTKEILDRIHALIERFKQLRAAFSTFDENGNVVGFQQLGALHKPLVDRIRKLNVALPWILPVVAQRRMMYRSEGKPVASGDDDEEAAATTDVVFSVLNQESDQQRKLFKEYQKNTLPNGVNKYEYLFSKLNEINTSFIPEEDGEVGSRFVQSQTVLENMDAIVQNFDNFYSTVNSATGKKSGNDALDRRRFVIQRYQLGMTKKNKVVMRSGKTVYVRENMTPNDAMSVGSLLMLPEPVVKFSHIRLPSTPLFQKTNLHQNYLSLFRLLRSKTQIGTYVVDNLDKEVAYNEDGNADDSRPTFLANFKEFLLENDEAGIGSVPSPARFEKFLAAVIPKTRVIFKLIRKYIQDKLTLVDIVKELEPFLIYPEDITYKQYDEIRYYVKHRLIDLREHFAKKAEIYKKWRNHLPRINREINRIHRVLFDNSDLLRMFESGYKLSDGEDHQGKTSSPSELLAKVISLDGAVLFCDLIATMMIKTLSTPENILESFEPAKLDDLTETAKIRAQDCVRRYLAKKYKNIGELRADNGKDDVFYDPDLDTWYSSYDYLNKTYLAQRKAMGPDEFREFLKMNLVHKHGVSQAESDVMARAIIEGKRRIEDGVYAMVTIDLKARDTAATPEGSPVSPSDSPPFTFASRSSSSGGAPAPLTKIQYFRRVKNQWVHDTSIHEEAFLDTSTLFCNIDEKCFQNQKNGTCESEEVSQRRIRELNKLRMKSEFSQRMAGSLEEMAQNIKRRLETDFKRILRERRLNQVKLEKFNNYAYDLGKLAVNEERVESAHTRLRDQILGQNDFQKTQADILRFVETFCREPLIDELAESPAWLYCRDTNTPLFPQSLYKLALVFCTGGNYAQKLAEICREVGILSDDGDSIVDKYSGYVLRKIDFVVEDEFTEEGMRVLTHDILEDELETRLGKILTSTENKTVIFENEANQRIYNICQAICQNIGIPVESVQEFVMLVTNELMEKHVQSAEVYEKKAQALEKKKGVRPIPYDIYVARFMFWILAAVLLIAIQTSIPSFRVKKTFPGCVRSFRGYPLDGGVEDMSGIQYIACVMFKLKSTVAPWNAIERLDLETYTAKIRETLEKIVLPDRPDIEQLYNRKREYMLLHHDEIIPREHSLDRWARFLPPLIPFSVTATLRPVSREFEREMMDLIRDGHAQQRNHLSMMKARTVQCGYAVIEAINNIVKSKDALLKTSSKIPFLENACCHDGEMVEPLAYFVRENPAIAKYLEMAQYLSGVVEDTDYLLGRPATLFHPGFTGLKYPVINDVTLVENIYGAFFHYCHFDTDTPIPEPFLAICAEKPSTLSGYKREWSMTDKIEFMKMNGKQYSPENLEQLMTMVRNRHLIPLDPAKTFLQVDAVRDLLESFVQTDSPVVEDAFRRHLLAVIDHYHPLKMVEEPRPELDTLKNYLAKTNERMYYAIVDFMDKYGNLEDGKFNAFQDWLMSPGGVESSTTLNHKDFLYKTTQNVKNMIYSMSRLFPEMILHEKTYDHIPYHWDLASVHVRDLEGVLSRYWSHLTPFFGDAVLTEVLRTVINRLRDIYYLVHELPVYSPLNKGERMFHALFDAEATYLMFIYLLYSTLYEYIVASESPETLQTESIAKKRNHRNAARDQSDAAASDEAVVFTSDEATEEAQEYLEEAQIRVIQPSELKTRVANLILAFVHIENENQAVFLPYETIAKKIGFSKKQEKKRITDYLGSLQEDERKIEDQFKQYKMGRWNAGIQRGLVHYDKDTYIRERTEMDANVFLGDMEAVDVDALEAEEARAVAEEYDGEGQDITEFGEDYGDGVYYAEDRDPDDTNE